MLPLIALVLALPGAIAQISSPRLSEALRPPPERPAARPIQPLTAPKPRPQPEIRRLRADLSGRVTARVTARVARIRASLRGAPARRALSGLRASLRLEEEQLRLDCDRALREMAGAPTGSVERELWSTAAQAGTVMLEDYSTAFAALDAAAPGR